MSCLKKATADGRVHAANREQHNRGLQMLCPIFVLTCALLPENWIV